MDIKNFQLEHELTDTKILKIGDFYRRLLSKRIRYIVDNYGIFEQLIQGNLYKNFDEYTEGFCRTYYVKGMTRSFSCFSEWFQAFWYKFRLIGEDPLKMYWKTKSCLGLLCQLLNYCDNTEFDLKVQNYSFIRDFINVIQCGMEDKINEELTGEPSPVRELWFMEDFSF